MKRTWPVFILLAALVVAPMTAWAEGSTVATRYAIAGTAGLTYDPNNDIDFVQITGVALFDYETVWRHRAPDPLRFKVELSAGVTSAPKTRAMASANILALYFIERLKTAALRPYVEAGIGLVYTDFQVHGQGLRVNFNPQLGVGAEIKAGERTWFTALRLHHLSNGGLHHDNRGVNSAVLQVGVFF